MRLAGVLLCMTLAGPLVGATRHALMGRAASASVARRPPLAGHRAHVTAVRRPCRDHAVMVDSRTSFTSVGPL
jgi:hypothetical protein